jgi:hypothetical protein
LRRDKNPQDLCQVTYNNPKIPPEEDSIMFWFKSAQDHNEEVNGDCSKYNSKSWTVRFVDEACK